MLLMTSSAYWLHCADQSKLLGHLLHPKNPNKESNQALFVHYFLLSQIVLGLLLRKGRNV